MIAGEVDGASRAIWAANVAADENGISLPNLGMSCAEGTEEINAFFDERGLPH